MVELIKELIAIGMKFKNRFVRHDVTARSAQMTYYFILSFFPFLITIISVVSYIDINQADLMRYVEMFLPTTIMPFVEATMQTVIEYRSATVLSVGALASIWSVSAGVTVMMKGIHRAYNTVDLSPYWIRKTKAVLYTALLVIMIPSMIVLLMFGNRLGKWFFYNFMPENAMYYSRVWDNLRLTIPIVGLFLGIYLIYKFIPRKHIREGCIWPGTVFTSVTWYLFSIGFSIYIDGFSSYNQMYGSLGSVFVLLVWLYASSILLLVGAEINSFYQDVLQDILKGKRKRLKR